MAGMIFICYGPINLRHGKALYCLRKNFSEYKKEIILDGRIVIMIKCRRKMFLHLNMEAMERCPPETVLCNCRSWVSPDTGHQMICCFMKEINFLNITSMVHSLLFMVPLTGRPIRRPAILF